MNFEVNIFHYYKFHLQVEESIVLFAINTIMQKANFHI